jgi:uncharacterized membrane protein
MITMQSKRFSSQVLHNFIIRWDRKQLSHRNAEVFMENQVSSVRHLYKKYIGYVGMFLGIGLISGSIVHLPIDPTRYTIIMVVGVVLFIIASILNEIILKERSMDAKDVITLIISSLLLSMGIGMMSGGIQHFEDVKEYAAYLIPIGLGVSLFSFIIKNQIRLPKKKFAIVCLSFLIIAAPLNLFLENLAHQPSDSQDTQLEHGHDGHDEN